MVHYELPASDLNWQRGEGKVDESGLVDEREATTPSGDPYKPPSKQLSKKRLHLFTSNNLSYDVEF